MTDPTPKEPSPFLPADNPAAIAHINLLQGIINRLATASASCKTWCLTLVAALLSLAGASHNLNLIPVALVPILMLGMVDARYLAQERAYRTLYGEVVAKIHGGTGKYTLADTFEAGAGRVRFRDFFSALRSWSIWPVYLGLIALYFIAKCTGLLVWLAK